MISSLTTILNKKPDISLNAKTHQFTIQHKVSYNCFFIKKYRPLKKRKSVFSLFFFKQKQKRVLYYIKKLLYILQLIRERIQNMKLPPYYLKEKFSKHILTYLQLREDTHQKKLRHKLIYSLYTYYRLRLFDLQKHLWYLWAILKQKNSTTLLFSFSLFCKKVPFFTCLHWSDYLPWTYINLCLTQDSKLVQTKLHSFFFNIKNRNFEKSLKQKYSYYCTTNTDKISKFKKVSPYSSNNASKKFIERAKHLNYMCVLRRVNINYNLSILHSNGTLVKTFTLGLLKITSKKQKKIPENFNYLMNIFLTFCSVKKIKFFSTLFLILSHDQFKCKKNIKYMLQQLRHYHIKLNKIKFVCQRRHSFKIRAKKKNVYNSISYLF